MLVGVWPTYEYTTTIVPLSDETAAVFVALPEVVEAEGSAVKRWSVGIAGTVGLTREGRY